MADNAPVPQVAPTPVPEAVTPPVQPVIVSSQSSDTPVVNPAESTTVESPTSEDVSEARKSKAQERIQDLVAERNAAKEYAEFWRSKALEVIRAPSNSQQAVPAQQTQAPRLPDTPPTLEQFGYDQAKHAEALSNWTKATNRQIVQQELQTAQARQLQAEIVQSYESKVETFRKEHADFDIVVSNPKLPALDRDAAAMIISSEDGAAITYHLAKNPEEAIRVARLSKSQQALAIGRLESTVRKAAPSEVQTAPAQTKPKAPDVSEVKQVPEVVKVTQAPEPPEPIPSGGPVEVSMESADLRDWMRMRAKEAKTRRRGGRVA
jgi:hypothetical protein